MRRLYSIIVCFAVLTGMAFADSSCGHTCHSDHADCRGFELGTAVGYTYLSEEDETAPALHLHVAKRLGDEGLGRNFSIGVGGEVIFAEHGHYALVVPFAVYPWRGLVLAVAPGLEWVEHEDEWESNYATHLETAYVFEMGRYDVGPVFEYSTSKHGEHYMLGIHCGIHF